MQGDELFYAYMVDNQAIVIPETIDAIRALAGTVRDGSESIARTNAALGIRGQSHFEPALANQSIDRSGEGKRQRVSRAVR